jgi:hypothetical protein
MARVASLCKERKSVTTRTTKTNVRRRRVDGTDGAAEADDRVGRPCPSSTDAGVYGDEDARGGASTR